MSKFLYFLSLLLFSLNTFSSDTFEIRVFENNLDQLDEDVICDLVAVQHGFSDVKVRTGAGDFLKKEDCYIKDLTLALATKDKWVKFAIERESESRILNEVAVIYYVIVEFEDTDYNTISKFQLKVVNDFYSEVEPRGTFGDFVFLRKKRTEISLDKAIDIGAPDHNKLLLLIENQSARFETISDAEETLSEFGIDTNIILETIRQEQGDDTYLLGGFTVESVSSENSTLFGYSVSYYFLNSEGAEVDYDLVLDAEGAVVTAKSTYIGIISTF